MGHGACYGDNMKKSFFYHNLPSEILRGRGGGSQRSSIWINQEQEYVGIKDKTGKEHTI